MHIKQHKHLDKKIWSNDDLLNPSVREMLLQIAWAYIDYIRCNNNFDIYNSDVKDVILYGSIVNHFYTKKSDIDICIVLDIDAIQKRYPATEIDKQFDFFKLNWKMGHKCLIYNRPVDISTENIITEKGGGLYRSGALYSIITNKWLRKRIVISHDEFKKIYKESDKIYKQMKRDYNIVKKYGFHTQDILRLYNNIYNAKDAAHDKNPEQPINAMHLAFRRFRSHGYFDKLQLQSAIDQSKEFTLK